MRILLGLSIVVAEIDPRIVGCIGLGFFEYLMDEDDE
jgi:hypothetical protein